MRIPTLLAALLVSLRAFSPSAAVAAEPTPPAYEPTSNYVKQDIRGWTVYVNGRLTREKKELGERTLELLDAQLYEITRAVPEKALATLRTVPIWVEVEDKFHPCACYHPDREWLVDHGYNPDKTGSVEIASAATFLKWTRQQPSMVLHELAHGFHDRMPGGYNNPGIRAAYERMKQSGSYESVLHWDGRRVRAYALNNPQEYFAELTEAWFGTNDYYPFVRSEVFKHDPEMARLLHRIWHGACYTPTAKYTRLEIEGWTVYVHPVLRGERKPLGDEALKLLEMKLYDLACRVPAPAVAKLREVPIWLESRGESCCYHPSRDWLIDQGLNPDKGASFEIGDAERFVREATGRQPMLVLHELAHAFHHRVAGHDHRGILAAYRRAVDSGSYESVLFYDGRRVRAYAMENEKEYFAELSEAWFGTNDFYPFVRAEVIEHDPEMAKVLQEVWGDKGSGKDNDDGRKTDAESPVTNIEY